MYKKILLLMLLCSCSFDEPDLKTRILDEELDEAFYSARDEFHERGAKLTVLTLKLHPLDNTTAAAVEVGSLRSIIYINERFRDSNYLIKELLILHEIGHVFGLPHGRGIMEANIADMMILYGAGRETYLNLYFDDLSNERKTKIDPWGNTPNDRVVVVGEWVCNHEHHTQKN